MSHFEIIPDLLVLVDTKSPPHVTHTLLLLILIVVRTCQLPPKVSMLLRLFIGSSFYAAAYNSTVTTRNFIEWDRLYRSLIGPAAPAVVPTFRVEASKNIPNNPS